MRASRTILLSLALPATLAFLAVPRSVTQRGPFVRLPATKEAASFTAVVPASSEALASFGVEVAPSAEAGVLWAASYPSNFESVTAMGKRRRRLS